MGSSDAIRIGFTDHRTNRSAVHHDSDGPTGAIELDTLIKKFVETSTAELKEFLLPLVRDFSTQLETTEKTYFRGLPYSKKHKLRCDRIGPSPDPDDNRYNIQGEQCLYLIDDKQFLNKELGTCLLLVQEYENIPFDSLRITDLSSENNSLNNILALAFQWAEAGRTATGYQFEEVLREKGKSKYLISQLLAECFKICKWDGIYVPGIHGRVDKHYHNLNIFAAKISNWRDWTSSPYYRYRVRA